eukprot:s420_g13.t1
MFDETGVNSSDVDVAIVFDFKACCAGEAKKTQVAEVFKRQRSKSPFAEVQYAVAQVANGVPEPANPPRHAQPLAAALADAKLDQKVDEWASCGPFQQEHAAKSTGLKPRNGNNEECTAHYYRSEPRLYISTRKKDLKELQQMQQDTCGQPVDLDVCKFIAWLKLRLGDNPFVSVTPATLDWDGKPWPLTGTLWRCVLKEQFVHPTPRNYGEAKYTFDHKTGDVEMQNWALQGRFERAIHCSSLYMASSILKEGLRPATDSKANLKGV